MEVILKENIVFNSFSEESELRETILKFIWDSKSDKILYKGDPSLINYKLLKKILPLEKVKHSQNKNSINQFVEIGENVREVYKNFLDIVGSSYCLIYKI